MLQHVGCRLVPGGLEGRRGKLAVDVSDERMAGPDRHRRAYREVDSTASVEEVPPLGLDALQPKDHARRPDHRVRAVDGVGVPPVEPVENVACAVEAPRLEHVGMTRRRRDANWKDDRRGRPQHRVVRRVRARYARPMLKGLHVQHRVGKQLRLAPQGIGDLRIRDGQHSLAQAPHEGGEIGVSGRGCTRLQRSAEGGDHVLCPRRACGERRPCCGREAGRCGGRLYERRGARHRVSRGQGSHRPADRGHRHPNHRRHTVRLTAATLALRAEGADDGNHHHTQQHAVASGTAVQLAGEPSNGQGGQRDQAARPA
eukprot:4214138-Prymnesium_polylepis.3